MRRYLFILLFFIVLVAPFVLRAALRTSSTPSSPSTTSAERLVIITPHNQDIRREFQWAFDKWHREKYGQGITIDYRTVATNDLKRQLEASYNLVRDKGTGKLLPPEKVNADIDVVFGGGDYFFDRELNRLFVDAKGDSVSILQPIVVDPALMKEAFPGPALAGVKLYQQDKDAAGNLLPPKWIGVCLSSFGIVYNAEMYQRLGMPEPQTWVDLTDPRLNGLLALADPTHSGSASVAYQMVLQRAMADAEEAYLAAKPKTAEGKPSPLDKKDPQYQRAIADGWHRGMGQLLLLAANARYFTDSAPMVPQDVGDGQAAAGVAIDFYGRVYQETVGPQRCRFISPRAATAITPDPVAILYGVKGRQLDLATHFVEFMLTKRAQELWIKRPGFPNGPRERALRRPPIRANLYASGADRTGWSDDVNPFTEAGTFNQRGEWMGLFSDTRPIWAAAWIDGRDALKDAWARIVAVPDDSRRAALIAALADIPVTTDQVKQQMDERSALEKSGGDVDQWKARNRVTWAKVFRQHYRAVAEQAAKP